MRISMARALAALLVAGAGMAACGDAPTVAAPRQASFDTGVPLSATVSCVSYYGTTYDCTAVASGGSGTGYSFSWSGGASEYYDQGGTSKAYVQCYKNYSGGYPTSGYLTAYGTVTDGNGNSTYFSLSRSC
jgi:hypothetical protein